MAKVLLTVDVVRTQLDQLQKDIEKIESKPIKVKVDASGKKAVEDVNKAMSQTATNANSATVAINKVNKTLEETNKRTESLYDNVRKFARWYIIGSVFSKLAGGFRDALKEMKAVDTELITVRKVTDMTAGELQNLTDTAYETAEALGATASAFLNAVSTFSKAGYDAQAESLAELAIKAANVGDTTQDVANQFLLAVDKAYQYQGSIESLTRVLDGANEIGNQYATDVEHIAEGLGLVAPVAAQAHISIEELTASIGTITAVTQRSGAEAARALRALILNILKDTKTEIEDGVTLSADEIEGLHDLLNIYASDVVKAAQATGKVINPMKAIEALAKSMKEGVLTEQELMGMATELGGKLRTTQLVALIQNWDMYNDMLETYRTSLGSADREYQIYLDSWEAKVNQLSATWTSFVNDIVSTDTIKTALDGIIKLVDILDNKIATTTIGVVTLAGTFAGLKKLLTFLGASKVVEGLKESSFILELLTTPKSQGGILGGLKNGIKSIASSPVAIATAVTTAVALAIKGLNYLDESLVRQQAKTEKLKNELKELDDYDGEFQKLKRKAATEGLTDAESKRLAVLESTYETLKKTYDLEKQKEADEYTRRFIQENYGGDTPSVMSGYSTGSKAWQDVTNASERYSKGELSLQAYAEALRDVVTGNADAIEQFKQYKELGIELNPIVEQYITLIDNVVEQLAEWTTNGDVVLEGLEETSGVLLTIEGALNKIQAPYELLVKAQSDVNEIGVVSADVVQKISSEHASLKKYLVQTANGYILTEGALEDFLNAQKAEYEIALTKAKMAALEVCNAQADEATAYSKTTDEIIKLLNAKKALSKLDLDEKRMFGLQDTSSVERTKAKNDLERAEEEYQAIVAAINTLQAENSKNNKKGGSGSSSKSDKDEYLNYLKSIVSLRESELNLLSAQNANIGTQVSKIKEIQDALHKEAEYLRSTDKYLKGDAETLAQINALSKQWYEYQDKIADLQKKLQDELNDAVNNELKKAKDARDEALKKIDEEIDKQKQINDDLKDANELEEKRNAVLEKRIALQNALNERNVRYYNAKTGQWEWGANAKTVADARKDLEEAEKDLADYKKDLAYEAKIADLENRKKAINEMYDALESQWQKITDSLQKPTRSISAILNDIATYGTPEMKKQINNVNSLLRELGVYLSEFSGAVEQPPVEQPTEQQITASNQGQFNYLNWSGKISTDTGLSAYNALANNTIGEYKDSNGNVWKYGGDGKVVVYTFDSNGNPKNWYYSYVDSAAMSAYTEKNKTAEQKAHDEAVRKIASGSSKKDRDKGKSSDPFADVMFDSGGVLYGLGGIKATRDNEMVLPPDVTKKMLEPSANVDFQKRLSELQYMYGAKTSVPPTLVNNTQGGIGKQYNGDIYQYGNITLTREEAKNTSVYDLARLSNKLCIYSKAN